MAITVPTGFVFCLFFFYNLIISRIGVYRLCKILDNIHRLWLTSGVILVDCLPPNYRCQNPQSIQFDETPSLSESQTKSHWVCSRLYLEAPTSFERIPRRISAILALPFPCLLSASSWSSDGSRRYWSWPFIVKLPRKVVKFMENWANFRKVSKVNQRRSGGPRAIGRICWASAKICEV